MSFDVVLDVVGNVVPKLTFPPEKNTVVGILSLKWLKIRFAVGFQNSEPQKHSKSIIFPQNQASHW